MNVSLVDLGVCFRINRQPLTKGVGLAVVGVSLLKIIIKNNNKKINMILEYNVIDI